MSTDLKDVLDTYFENGMLNVHTALPGIVIEFNSELQTATVQLAINKIIRATGEEVIIAPIIDVPVVQMTAGGFHITMPIVEGDECLVIFSERAVDNWFIEGKTQPPAEFRHHNISDGFAIIGVNSKPNAIPQYNETGLEIRNEEGDQRVILHPDKTIEIITPADINITTEESVNITAKDNVNIAAENDAVISTGENTQIDAGNDVIITAKESIHLTASRYLYITAADIEVIGFTKWAGNIELMGNIDMTGTFDLNGITVDTHTHIGDSGGNTGPMQ